MEKLVQDVRYALRSARQSAGFTLVCVLTLALGIGSATAIFTLVDQVVLKPLSYRQPGRLAFVREVDPPLAHVYPTLPVNFQHFGYWREHARSFESMAAFRSTSATLTGAGRPELLDGVETTGALFTVLGVQPAIGRLLASGDDTPASSVVVITDSLWQRRFSRASGMVGKTISLDGAPRTVIGILPGSFRFPAQNDLGPLAGLGKRIEFFVPVRNPLPGWGGDYDYAVVARLREGVPLAKGTAELNILEEQIVAQHKLDAGVHAVARSLGEVVGGPMRTALTVLFAAVLLLLLIVCVNIANLQLARSSARAREFAIRAALGASRARLVEQVLVESLLLSVAGGALGIFAAFAAVQTFVSFAPVHIPRIDEVRVDLSVLLFAIGVSLICGVVFGLVPAVRFARIAPQDNLRAGSYTSTGSRGHIRLRDFLVGSEVAISAVLLMLAGLLTNSLWKLLHVDKGFTVENAIAVRFLPVARFHSDAERNQFLDKTLQAVRSVPGVASAAFIAGLPLTGETMVNGVDLAGTDQNAINPATHQAIFVNVRFVSEDYFRSIGIPLVKGRVIESADRDRRVAVISERLAALLWPNANPVGRTLRTGSHVGKIEVAGVVRDVHNAGLDGDPTPIIYVPFWLRGQRSGDIVIRTSMNPSALMPEVQRRLWALDRDMPVPAPRTVAQIVSEATAPRRLQMQISGAFAISALALAALGIYGVVSYSAARRRKEIGIRLALGARPGEVRWMMVAHGLGPVAAGLAVGLGASLGCGKLVRSLLYQVNPADPATMAAVAAGLFVIGLAACALPARAAAALDPAGVLRDE
jgi:putative ABC transport system permease protein